MQYIDQPGVAFCTKISTDENAITNAVDIYRNPRLVNEFDHCMDASFLIFGLLLKSNGGFQFFLAVVQ